MVINGLGNVAASAASKGRAGPKATGFTVGTGNPAAPAALSAAAPLDGLLLLQEVEGAPDRDRRARKHGRAMLDALGRLQLALLGGEPDSGTLQTLAALLEQAPEAADPALRDMLGAIVLRAEVEIARAAM